MKNVKEVIGGNNTFAIDLYSQLKKPEKNLFFSPFSIFTALAMIYAGARGLTATQMKEALYITLDQDSFHSTLNALLRTLHSEESVEGFELNITSALWVQRGYDLLQEFLNIIQENYGEAMYKVNFAAVMEACAKINAWVAKQTREKIKGIIAPNSIDEFTRLILINAIYFKGIWAKPFKKIFTMDAPFKLVSGKTVSVPMMGKTDTFGYLKEENLQVLEMPYQGNRMSMIIFLPKTTEGLTEFESASNLERLVDDKYLLRLRKQEVYIGFPRFTMETKFSLKSTLSDLGINDAFTPDADFSEIMDLKPFFISDVIHKAFVEVNEKGTEAAAATAVVKTLGAGLPKNYFRADHPFLFIIRDLQSKSILFIGRLMNPQ